MGEDGTEWNLFITVSGLWPFGGPTFGGLVPLKCRTFSHFVLMQRCNGGDPGVSQTKPRDCVDVYRALGVGARGVSEQFSFFVFCLFVAVCPLVAGFTNTDACLWHMPEG